MRRRPKIAVLAAMGLAAVALVAYGVRSILFDDESEPVSAGEAAGGLELAGGEARRVNGAPVPPSGAYEYATEGEERLEAFVSATHAYPELTTITVSRGGCGVLMRWIPLEQRQSEWDLCPGRERWGLASLFEIHEFFGQRDERTYECVDGVAFQPAGRWSYRCGFESRTDVFEGRVLGTETVMVGGRRVRTLHVLETDSLSGEEEGSGSVETWYRRDGLLVRRVATTRDRTPVPGGTGTYSERYELRLVSLRPLR